MTPTPRTFFTKFVFSLKVIIPDLESDALIVKENLAKNGHVVSIEDIYTSWVMFQLERHLFLTIETEGQYLDAQRLFRLIDKRFFHQHATARDLLLAQIRPALTYRETVPYTERICKVEIRHPDLHLHFL